MFSESIYNDCFSIAKYNKEKTMNQMREKIFFDNESWCKDKKKLYEMYSETKNELKDKNKKLHDLFYKNKKIYLYNILEQFDIVNFIQIPKFCDKTKITNGRFVWFDGNSKCFIGETNSEYYIAKWSGS